MGSTGASGWSSPESISEPLSEPGARRYDISTGLGGRRGLIDVPQHAAT